MRSRMNRPIATRTIAEQERHPPAPGQERRLRQRRTEHGEDASGQQQPGGYAHLRPGAVEAALAGWGVLHGQHHRAAPLAADAEALSQAEDHQEDRGGHADGAVGGQQADQERGNPHDQQREDQHLLAADPVAVVAEDDPADRAGQEADGVSAEGQQRAGKRRELGEEELVEHQRGGGAVEEEVVPLDGGPDEARRGYLPDGGPLTHPLAAEPFHAVHAATSCRRQCVVAAPCNMSVTNAL